jgi:hypothetical protein
MSRLGIPLLFATSGDADPVSSVDFAVHLGKFPLSPSARLVVVRLHIKWTRVEEIAVQLFSCKVVLGFEAGPNDR